MGVSPMSLAIKAHSVSSSQHPVSQLEPDLHLWDDDVQDGAMQRTGGTQGVLTDVLPRRMLLYPLRPSNTLGSAGP